MTTIKQVAQETKELEKTKNIAELEKVSVDMEVFTEQRGEGDKAFEIDLIKVEDQEYRVPKSVLRQLKTLIENKPEMTEFQVLKSGEGMETSYQVVPLN